MVKDPQVWRETEDWLKMVKMHSERFRTKLSIQVMNEYVKDILFSSLWNFVILFKVIKTVLLFWLLIEGVLSHQQHKHN